MKVIDLNEKKIEKKEMEEGWDKGGENGGKERKGEKVKVL